MSLILLKKTEILESSTRSNEQKLSETDDDLITNEPQRFLLTFVISTEIIERTSHDNKTVNFGNID